MFRKYDYDDVSEGGKWPANDMPASTVSNLITFFLFTLINKMD
jgi:hypothetical protein